MTARLEHANITVSDARASAQMLQDLFGWHIRWEGPALDGGYTIHVGTDTDYLALYTPRAALDPAAARYRHQGAVNHIGLVVDDLDAAEEKVRAAGYEPHSHYDYEPGRRFYFMAHDDVEYEIVSYA